MPKQENSTSSGKNNNSDDKSAKKKDIPEGVSYINTPNLLKKVLDKIISAQVPEKFTQDYLGTVLGFTGGSAKAVIPLLKRIEFLHTDGKPTDAYSKFRTTGGRNAAVKHALKSGFREFFKRNEHSDAATESKLLDLAVEITGREKNDQVVKAIVSTFQVIASYFDKNSTDVTPPEEKKKKKEDSLHIDDEEKKSSIGISYQINLHLPETTDIEVFDAIFQSLKKNMLR